MVAGHKKYHYDIIDVSTITINISCFDDIIALPKGASDGGLNPA
jgi:hypothetical protein